MQGDRKLPMEIVQFESLLKKPNSDPTGFAGFFNSGEIYVSRVPARLDVMGSNLYQLDPGFDPRTYGQKQLSRLVGNMKDAFEMRTQEIDGSMIFYIKMKE